MRCPICGGEFNAIDAMMDSEWREIVCLFPSFGAHGKLAFEYCEKFGVNPLRIKSKKLLRLLTEMSRLFVTGEFEYRRRKYAASKRVVIEAITVVNNKYFDNPLENHNYLKKVMISLVAEEAKEASKAAERELRLKEDRLQAEGREGELEIGNEKDGVTASEYLAISGKTSLREK